MINGKRYIGQKKFDIEGRWRSYLGSGVHLQNAFKKYGKDKFIRNIVDIAHSLDELNQKEIRWIENYDAVNNDDYYNATDGGGTSTHLKDGFPIINIDTNHIFKTIKDAMIWSGYSRDKIITTFKFKHSMDCERSILLFKPLDNLEFKHRLCSFCGLNFKNSNPRIKCCSKCKLHKNYNDRMKDKLQIPPKMEICLDTEDAYVISRMRKSEINNSLSYKEKDYLIWDYNLKLKDIKQIIKKNSKAPKVSLSQAYDILEENREQILRDYINNNGNISKIKKELVHNVSKYLISKKIKEWKG